MWSSLSHCASQQLREFSGRHLANVSWSLAALARSDAPLLLSLSYEVMLKAEASLDPFHMTNLVIIWVAWSHLVPKNRGKWMFIFASMSECSMS